MINLLSANLFRLRKSILFWITLLLSFGFGAFMCVTRYREQFLYNYEVSLNSVFFGWALLIGLVLSVFLPLFFGTEYSDGTIRNKIIAGQRRHAIYVSTLITTFLSAVLFCAAYMLACVVVGVPLIGWLTVKTGVVLVSCLEAFIMTASWCALFTAVFMNCSRKAASAVSCMLLLLLLSIAALTVYQMLDAPEFYPAYSLTADGQMTSIMEPNLAYLTEDQRPFYEFLLDLNPMGQALQYVNLAPARPLQMALCSLGLFAATTAAGAALFGRKDLK